MDTHTKVLGWLYIVLGVLGMLGAGFIIFILVGSGLISGDRTAISVLLIVAAFVGGFLALVSLPGIIAGVGLLAYRPWARVFNPGARHPEPAGVPIGDDPRRLYLVCSAG